jgi:hypothetical protein
VRLKRCQEAEKVSGPFSELKRVLTPFLSLLARPWNWFRIFGYGLPDRGWKDVDLHWDLVWLCLAALAAGVVNSIAG